VILGVGIGPVAVGLSVVDRVLLQPLGYAEPDRLGVVRIDIGELRDHPGLHQGEILDLRQQETEIFERVEHAIFGQVSLGKGEELFAVSMASVSAGFFETLGVLPELGRTFNLKEEEEDRQVVVLSHHLWQSRFGADPDIVYQTILLEGRPHEVVGVAPAGFTLRLGRGSYCPPVIDMWRPLRAVRGPTRNTWGWNTIVRLADGVSFEQANQILEAFALRQVEAHPDVYADARLRFVVHPLLEDLVREARPALNAALAAVCLLLFTAMVNATALVLVSLRRRDRELAMRSVLGAGQWPLVVDVLFESLVLATAGGALGGFIALWGMDLLRALIPRTVPRWDTLTVGWEPVFLAAVLALATLSVAGLFPAWKVTRREPWRGLSEYAQRGWGRGPMQPRAQFALVAIQVAMAVVLLFGSLQLGRSASELAATDLQFDPDNVLAFEVPLYGLLRSGGKPAENRRYMLIRDRLRELPGVVSVGAISSPPLSGRGTVNRFTTDLTDENEAWHDVVANFYAVLPGYMDSVRTPLRRGRLFTDQENLNGEHVVIVDETLARTAFAGEDPIGKTLRMGAWRLPDVRIVGVVAHARLLDPTREVRPQIYLPFGVFRWAPLYFTVRTEGDPRLLLPGVREVVRRHGTGSAVMKVQVLSENLASATATLRAVATLVVVLALCAALLSAIGVYAVVSAVVMQQRHATAVRSALGATPRELVRGHLVRASPILMAAVPLGLGVTWMGARLLESLLYGVDVRDVESLAAAAALGLFIGLLATFLPARRAAKADPLTTLKCE
jgi:predicted permease